MKLTKLSAYLVSTFLFSMPVLLLGADVAQVVYELPDGAVYNRSGQSVPLYVGDQLSAGDSLSTGDATVILSLCDGSLVTVYPNTEVRINTLGQGAVALRLIRGEILGDNGVGCAISVGTTVGEAAIEDGVFGILLNQMGDEGWTLQVRNLDGKVVFTGDPKLDTSNVVVTLLEPNKAVTIPAGEEFIVRGVYNAEEEVFALAQDGVAMALLGSDTSGQLREAAEMMAAYAIPEGQGQQGQEPQKVEIEIPNEDIDTASDKG